MNKFFQQNLFHITLLLLALHSPVLYSDITNTKHNLSVTGTGTIKASGEQEICIFCHTPHQASPVAPLWNRASSGSIYTPYNSSSIFSSPGQPTGASMLCLSCHDGTIALGSVLSRSTDIVMDGGVTTMPLGTSHIGTDLSDDHPISFDYTAGLATQRGELVDPGTLTGPVKVDKNSQMQCTSCHDPHNNANGKFLVMPNTASALCQTCHVKDFWNETVHESSLATWNGTNPDPWPHTDATTVASNACENCHSPHNAGSQQRILNYAAEENNCISCHNGNVANHDIAAEFNKFALHPITDTTDIHDPLETAVVNNRHVECIDCHNPHAANSTNPLNGVRGIDQGGSEVASITRTEQLCYRCHGDSNNKPAPLTTRQIGQTNVRMEFDTANPSYHPVASTGKNPDVPSLIAPLSTNSTISCLDCHNNNNGPGANGSGPNGPHGSTYESILERQYLKQDPTAESPTAYAMCYKCHDRSIILSSQSFSKHVRHVSSVQTPCNTCHDPHGISATQGNAVNNSHLMNFDTSIVTPDRNGILKYEDTGVFKGSCYLTCHGMNHSPKSYR